MNIKQYKIFNNYYKFNFGKTNFCKVIEEEFELYPKWEKVSEGKEVIEVYVDPDFNIENEYKFYRNPKEHFYNKDVFGVDLSWGRVFWIFSRNQIIVYSKEENYNFLRKKYALLKDPQFYLPYQWAGQRLQEDVLAGDMMFRKNMFILHGSALATKDGKVVMIGGTGGTGKTSTLISLGKRNDIYFVCDDLCIINNSGQVFVNYSYPKVYAYNTVGSKEFENMIIENDSYFGKFQWEFKKKTKGLSSVRRRIKPTQLYNILPEDKIDDLELSTYIILNRTNSVNEININKISSKIATEISYKIIKNEMNKFYVPLTYRKLNSLYDGEESYYDEDSIFNQWKKYMNQALEKIDILQVDIPFNYDNEKLKEEMSNIICSKLGLK